MKAACARASAIRRALADDDRAHRRRRRQHPPRDAQLPRDDKLGGARHGGQEDEQDQLGLRARLVGRTRSRHRADVLRAGRDAGDPARDRLRLRQLQVQRVTGRVGSECLPHAPGRSAPRRRARRPSGRRSTSSSPAPRWSPTGRPRRAASPRSRPGISRPISTKPRSAASRRSATEPKRRISILRSVAAPTSVTSCADSVDPSASTSPTRAVRFPPTVMPRTRIRMSGRRTEKNRAVRSRMVRTRFAWTMAKMRLMAPDFGAPAGGPRLREPRPS